MKRIIKCVDGVDSVSIELESGKVTVTGCVDSKAVLQSLQKAGKHAEIWHNAGKAVNLQNQAANKPANNKMNDGNANNHEKKNKAVAFEELLPDSGSKSNPKGKGFEANINGGGHNGGGGVKYGGDKVNELGGDIATAMVPHGAFNLIPITAIPSNGLDKPSFISTNNAMVSKSVAPRPTVYAETSYSLLESSEYATAEYATHMFSDENANNCSVM